MWKLDGVLESATDPQRERNGCPKWPTACNGSDEHSLGNQQRMWKSKEKRLVPQVKGTDTSNYQQHISLARELAWKPAVNVET